MDRDCRHADRERESLLKSEQSSFFSYAKLRTPKLGEFEWWILFLSCLLTITFQSAWQVTVKVVMSLNLESTQEVCAYSFVTLEWGYLSDR